MDELQVIFKLFKESGVVAVLLYAVFQLKSALILLAQEHERLLRDFNDKRIDDFREELQTMKEYYERDGSTHA